MNGAGRAGSSLGYPTGAAKAGDTVELFGVGFGPTNPAVPAGALFCRSGSQSWADDIVSSAAMCAPEPLDRRVMLATCLASRRLKEGATRASVTVDVAMPGWMVETVL